MPKRISVPFETEKRIRMEREREKSAQRLMANRKFLNWKRIMVHFQAELQ